MVHAKVEKAVCIPREWILVFKKGVSILLREVVDRNCASKRYTVPSSNELSREVRFFMDARTDVGRFVVKMGITHRFDEAKAWSAVAIQTVRIGGAIVVVVKMTVPSKSLNISSRSFVLIGFNNSRGYDSVRMLRKKVVDVLEGILWKYDVIVDNNDHPVWTSMKSSVLGYASILNTHFHVVDLNTGV
jgi:hypothetical protein